MARPAQIDTDTIVERARELFLEHGFSLSTAAIARELGISEGSIYKRFASKDELFCAAMGLPDCDFAREWPALAGQGTPRDNLVAVGSELVAYFRELLPRMMMLWSQSGPNPLEAIQAGEEPSPRVLQRELTTYLDAEMRQGRLRDGDPIVAARMLLGAFHNYAFFELVGLQPDAEPSADDYVEAVVETMIQGLAP